MRTPCVLINTPQYHSRMMGSFKSFRLCQMSRVNWLFDTRSIIILRYFQVISSNEQHLTFCCLIYERRKGISRQFDFKDLHSRSNKSVDWFYWQRKVAAMIKTSADRSKLNEFFVQKHPIYSLDGKLFLFTTMSHLQVIIWCYSESQSADVSSLLDSLH